MMTTTRVVAAACLALLSCGPAPEAQRAEARTGSSLFAAAADAQWRLPRRLHEISGLAVAPDGRLFGHDDEAGVIHELSLEAGGGVVKSFALGEPVARGDFEGLAIAPDGAFYIVESTGRLLRFREAGDGAHAPFETLDTGMRDVCEIEGLAYHARRRGLLIACKAHRETTDVVLYLWSLRTRRASVFLQAPASQVAQAAFVQAFRPSGVEIDPRTNRVIVLSARDRAWAEFSAAGVLLAARRLAGAHPQPEGIAVLRDGALAVADEGGDLRALLTRYPRTP
jgi:uncharacterized protein YjiK